MPDAFDEEFDTGVDEDEEVQAAPVTQRQAAVDSMVDQFSDNEEVVSEEEEGPTEYMGEVDDRLEIATYYRSLLRNPLFNENTRAAKIVEREHRTFIRERLEVLLSIRAPGAVQAPVSSPFSPEEIEGLKILIGQMRSKGMLSSVAPAPVPKPAPVPAKAPIPQQSARGPAPRPAPSPTSARRTAPPAPVAKPAARQMRRRPPAPEAPAAVRVETVINPNTGKTFERKIQQVQNPSGAMPFPRDVAQVVQTTSAPASMSGNSLIGRLANQAINTAASE